MDTNKRFVVSRSGIAVLAIMLIVVCALGIYSFYTYQNNNETKSQTELLFETNDNYEPYKDLLGNEVSLEQYLDKVIVVHSWASWCPTCVDQIKMFESSTANQSDDVQIIAINRAEPATTIERFKTTFAIGDAVLMVLDPSDRFYTSVGAYAMPETLIYDQQGNVALHVHGEVSKQQLEEKIAELLSEN